MTIMTTTESPPTGDHQRNPSTWEHDTPAYDSTEFKPYWCAIATFPDGPRPVYTFGLSTGRWGKAGVLSVKAEIGDVVAYGQRHVSDPSRNQHVLVALDIDGTREVDLPEAYRFWTTHHVL